MNMLLDEKYEQQYKIESPSREDEASTASDRC